MENLKIIKDYRENEVLRNSFNDLASSIFGISFESWHEAGFWTDKYQPYSFIDGEKVVANVSVNLIDMIIEGERRRAVQIGTVMTHPDYRNKGLSAKLMHLVLADFEGRYDLMYLFANQSVLQFYPKFGFERAEEYLFSAPFSGERMEGKRAIKLNGRNPEHLRQIFDFAACRVPVSQTLGTITPELLMFYCMNPFSDDIYFLEDERAMVIYKEIGNELHLFDLISQQDVSIHTILSQIAGPETEEILFHYTPDYRDFPTQKEVYQGDEVLFVKTAGNTVLPAHFKHPLTSQA